MPLDPPEVIDICAVTPTADVISLAAKIFKSYALEFFRGFLEALWHIYEYIYLWSPGVEGTDETIAASRNASVADGFVARFGTAVETVAFRAFLEAL